MATIDRAVGLTIDCATEEHIANNEHPATVGSMPNARPVIDRVCTPLGLVFNKPTETTDGSLGASASQTLQVGPSSTTEDDPKDHSTELKRVSRIPRRPVPRRNSSTSEIPPLYHPTTTDTTETRTPDGKIGSIPYTPSTGDYSNISTAVLENVPLHTCTVQSNTRMVHPKPITPSTPDVNSRPGTATATSNVAQLEATAERLSMTSSIDAAIRELHGELKRSDSRRSEVLAAMTKDNARDEAPSSSAQLSRHLSNSSSIVSTNTAARHGGYSPAAFIMSPTHSLSGRIRSNSNSSGPITQYDTDPAMILSRHGPGRSSFKSIRSGKPSLAEISESEPITLTHEALDEADLAPPVEDQDHTQDVEPMTGNASTDSPSADMFHNVWNTNFDLNVPSPQEQSTTTYLDHHMLERSSTRQSDDTSYQASHEFADFDGAYFHEEPSEPGDAIEYQEAERIQQPKHSEAAVNSSSNTKKNQATPRPVPVGRTRPQSYFDHEAGVQMLYYPARVPAMLNLPPKLSKKTKTAARNQRQEKVLSSMWGTSQGGVSPGEIRRYSAMPQLAEQPSSAKFERTSWLPDLRSEYRDSSIDLPGNNAEEPHASPSISHSVGASSDTPKTVNTATLRLPQKLSQESSENRKSRAQHPGQIPTHLRATAYFDLPSTSPAVELKGGSAMATLDGILDASAAAPVSAFTDHAYAGKLGTEVYGKVGKHKSMALPTSLSMPLEDSGLKKRVSSMWLGKRSTSYNGDLGNREEMLETHSLLESMEDHEGDGPMKQSEHEFGEKSNDNHDENAMNNDDEEPPEEDEEEVYNGPPTTLLAELQLRKQQQKERTRNRYTFAPQGLHSTLLEMDTVAETQRKNRQAKRVTLAWEEEDAHVDQNGSDDDDVPLAIIAAKHAGAKNMADVERPLGLMDKRDIEDNEPLSHRRARLQGRNAALEMQRPHSSLTFAPSRLGDPNPPMPLSTPTPEPIEEIEEETLADRRRRLAGEEEPEVSLPRTRPVSRAFSEELLSQFGDFKEADESLKAQEVKQDEVQEETLGQRRRRLQAERAARDREMSFSNLVGGGAQEAQQSRRLDMASVLSAHPRKSPDLRAKEERLRREEQDRAARERDAKLAAMRMQMPTTLQTPFTGRAGAFNGGIHNDGMGGAVSQRPRPVTMQFSAPIASTPAYGPFYQTQQPSQVFSGVAMGAQQPLYGVNTGLGGYGQFGLSGGYNNVGVSAYGGAMMSPQTHMQMAAGPGSIDMVERWRRSIKP